MSLSTSESLRRIEAAIEAEELPPAPGVLTGYVILTEWVASDGQVYLVESIPDQQSYWRTLGLLAACKHRVESSAFFDSDETQDGEDDDD